MSAAKRASLPQRGAPGISEKCHRPVSCALASSPAKFPPGRRTQFLLLPALKQTFGVAGRSQTREKQRNGAKYGVYGRLERDALVAFFFIF